MVRCNTHPFDEADSACKSCGHTFCAQCLVWPQGATQPALCIRCALAKSGVRSRARAVRSA